MKSGLKILTFIFFFSATFFYSEDVIKFANFGYSKFANYFYNPCKKPITIKVGQFDERFKFSKEELIGAINQAVAIWETNIDKNLFDYDEAAEMNINLVYDERQQATDKLKELGIKVSTNESSYQLLKNKYESLSKNYESKKNIFDNDNKKYEELINRYNIDISTANKRVVNKTEYEKISLMQQQLENDRKQLEAKRLELNSIAATINALANNLNKIAAELNLHVGLYNTVGSSVGETFDEGVFEQVNNQRKITIYQFDSREQLVRVLAHELGHALGLDHSNNQDDIMYKFNQNDNLKLSATDIENLKKICPNTN